MDFDELWANLGAEVLATLQEFRSRIAELVVVEKEDHTLLTQADLSVEALISKGIRLFEPNACILAEESWADARHDSDVSRGRVWIIDPIDGTAEFVRPDRAEFCSVVCVLDEGQPMEALVVAPELGVGRSPLVMTASRTGGVAFVNGHRARLNADGPPSFSASITRSSAEAARPFERAMAEAGYNLKTRTTSQTLDMVRTALNLRGLAAAGTRFDLFYRRDQKVWDGVAGLCFGEVAHLTNADLTGARRLPVNSRLLAVAEPTFDVTVLGRPEAVEWFSRIQ
jgi:fructose-1,6-bisphosphatase/inositol monophosphatase family enzyme